MKKKFLFLLIIVLPFVFFSCNDFSIKWEAVTVDGKNGAKITEINIKNGYEPTITIPSKVGGRPVLSLDLSIKGRTAELVAPEPVIEISKIHGDGINTLDLSRIRSLEVLGKIKDLELSNIKFPKIIKQIGDYAFNCPSLNHIDLSNTDVETINSRAFYDCCNSLYTIKFPKSLKSIPDFMFIDDNYINYINSGYNFSNPPSPNFFDSLRVVDLSGTDIETIGSYAFYGCDSLEVIKFPETLKSIGEGAFSGCEKLKKADLSNTKVETIGNEVFQRTGLEKIKFPVTLKSIGESAFDWSNLKELDLSNTKVETIGCAAFQGCKLEKIKFPVTLKSIFDNAFRDNLIPSDKYKTLSVSSIKEIVLPYPGFRFMILDSKSYYDFKNDFRERKQRARIYGEHHLINEEWEPVVSNKSIDDIFDSDTFTYY